MSHYQITIQQGATFSRRFFVYQASSATIVGDLTGFSVRCVARTTVESSTAAITFTGVVVTAASALCEISLTAAETAAETEGNYYGDVEVYSGTTVYRAFSATFVVTREVTR